MLIKITAYLPNDDYADTSGPGGLLIKGKLEETDCIINTDDILYAFPSKVPDVETMLKFRNGLTLDIKETLDEILTKSNKFGFAN